MKAEPAPSYGGQAVIEGVMMRGPSACATAVRAPDGGIQLDVQRLASPAKTRLGKIPLVRGLVVLIDTLRLGFRALSFSANVQAPAGEKLTGASMAATMTFSVVLGLGLFFVLPAAAAFALERGLKLGPAAGNLVEGLLRLSLLLTYLWGIGRIPEIERVYAYHGAEHRTIHAHEAGRPLHVEEVAAFPNEHPRCGTAFLLTIVVFSVLLFSLLGEMPLGARLGSRLLLVPVLAGLAYEYIRWTSKLQPGTLRRLLVAPNLALQRLTTRDPEPAMIEVAIAAFEAMRRSDIGE
jgi:uncharacterized protein YqhQ